MAAKTVEEHAPFWPVDTRERLFDPSLGDRSQQARFGSVMAYSATLVTWELLFWESEKDGGFQRPLASSG